MASNNKLTLKLLIEKESQKVLFAEAGKVVVDFLFSLLAMPIGSVIKLITKESMTGCLGATYGSLEQLDDTYLLSTQTKSHLLNPTSSTEVSTNSLLLLATDAPSSFVKQNEYYTCPGKGSYLLSSPFDSSQVHNYVTDAYGTACPDCRTMMTKNLEFVAGSIVKKEEENWNKGFVKGVVTYTIIDDLSVMPMSTVSSITLLNKFCIKNLSNLQEKTVDLGLTEGLELLKASLQSKNVVTDVLLTKKKRRA
ncbi:hypothetical protein FCM35_KLT00649 [Carex littledalei]|uniref:DUF674 domain-containing protein n=1 Tax=Carex littledalei TaxID=544730 RepID=A0A833VLR0_9POAL|nr:hypothetical protein FCM35_KLT00649 [Carex littledalei]